MTKISPLKAGTEGEAGAVASPVVVPLASVSVTSDELRERCEKVAQDANHHLTRAEWKAKEEPPHLSMETLEDSDFKAKDLAEHLASVIRCLCDDGEGALGLGTTRLDARAGDSAASARPKAPPIDQKPMSVTVPQSQ